MIVLLFLPTLLGGGGQDMYYWHHWMLGAGTLHIE